MASPYERKGVILMEPLQRLGYYLPYFVGRCPTLLINALSELFDRLNLTAMGTDPQSPGI